MSNIETLALRDRSVVTDGWKGYSELRKLGYAHHQIFQGKTDDNESVLPGVHLMVSLIKRLVLGTFQGRFMKKYLRSDLDNYTFRFNRRTTKHGGKRFFRIVQQAVISGAITQKQIRSGAIRPALAN